MDLQITRFSPVWKHKWNSK